MSHICVSVLLSHYNHREDVVITDQACTTQYPPVQFTTPSDVLSTSLPEIVPPLVLPRS